MPISRARQQLQFAGLAISERQESTQSCPSSNQIHRPLGIAKPTFSIGAAFKTKSFPIYGTDCSTICNHTRQVQAITATRSRQQHLMQLGPDSRFLPLPPATPASYTGATSHFLWQHCPWNARLQHKQNARQYAPVLQTLATGVKLTALRHRQQRLDYFPQLIIKQLTFHIASQKSLLDEIRLDLSCYMRLERMPQAERRTAGGTRIAALVIRVDGVHVGAL